MTTQERDAWSAGYRIYDEYAPKLRQAASAGDKEMAGNIFATISNRITSLYNASDQGGKLVLLSVYDLLSNVFETCLHSG